MTPGGPGSRELGSLSAADGPGGGVEGVRPRNAMCAHCGYVFGAAVPIVDGAARCPECGKLTPFSFDAMAARRAERTRLLPPIGLMVVFIVLLVIVAMAIGGLGMRTAGPGARFIATVGAVAVVAVVIAVLSSLRRGLVGRRPRP